MNSFTEINERLDELAELGWGWYDGHGGPINPIIIKGVRDYFSKMSDPYFPYEVFIYPYPHEYTAIEVHILHDSGLNIELKITGNEEDVLSGEFMM